VTTSTTVPDKSSSTPSPKGPKKLEANYIAGIVVGMVSANALSILTCSHSVKQHDG